MDGRDEPAIGIDLGTTYSCVAIFRNELTEIIENKLGERLTPSVVGFTKHGRLVGRAAMNQAATNPANTVYEVKRLMGRKFEDRSVQDDIKHWLFQVAEGEEGNPIIKVNHKGRVKEFTAEEISAMVLSYLKEAAEILIGHKVKNAVVTVPAHFNKAQRCATRNAATIAGLNVLGLIDDPTAAALAYGLNKTIVDERTGKRNVLIFKLGQKTFDVAVLEIKDDVLGVKATIGDIHLGGADFDDRLMKHFARKLERTHGLEAIINPRVLRRLRAKCEGIKLILSGSSHATIHIEALYDGEDFTAEISRSMFEKLNSDLFEKYRALVERCIQDANLDKSQINDVVLVGGSSRIPGIQEILQEQFGRDILRKSINPDEVIARGAAIQAAMLSRGSNNYPIQRTQVAFAKEQLDFTLYDIKNKIQSPAMARRLDASQSMMLLGTIDKALEWCERNKYTATPSDYDNKKAAALRVWETFRVNLQLSRD